MLPSDWPFIAKMNRERQKWIDCVTLVVNLPTNSNSSFTRQTRFFSNSNESVDKGLRNKPATGPFWSSFKQDGRPKSSEPPRLLCSASPFFCLGGISRDLRRPIPALERSKLPKLLASDGFWKRGLSGLLAKGVLARGTFRPKAAVFFTCSSFGNRHCNFCRKETVLGERRAASQNIRAQLP